MAPKFIDDLLFRASENMFCPNKLSVIDRANETERNPRIKKNPLLPINVIGKEMKDPNTRSLFYGLLNPGENYPKLRKKGYPLYYDVTFVEKSFQSYCIILLH